MEGKRPLYAVLCNNNLVYIGECAKMNGIVVGLQRAAAVSLRELLKDLNPCHSPEEYASVSRNLLRRQREWKIGELPDIELPFGAINEIRDISEDKTCIPNSSVFDWGDWSSQA